MNRDMKIFMAAVAVFCSYLIISLPFSSALQVNFIFNQVSLGSTIINPQDLVSKELSIGHDALWSRVSANLEVRVAQPQYEIKRAYVYFCGGLDPLDCITKTPVTFESYVNVSRDWNDVFSGQAYRYPQTANVLTVVRVDIGGKIVWTGFWDQIERLATKEFKIRSYDVSSVDAYLKSSQDLNLTKGFVEKYMMIPTQWVESTSFGMINQTDTQLLYGVGANQSEIPQFRPWKTTGRTVSQVGKEYEFVFPATASFIANPAIVNSNPPYICGNSVCEAEAGENQKNCCLDCTDPRTRACTGELANYTCYVDGDNPYGYCGSKCGEKGCERGENPRSCCLDCGCSEGFICDVSQWNPSGSCINASAINLILDSAKTKYSCCEIPHDIELRVHIMNPPSDMHVQQWYYILDNETGTSISSERAETLTTEVSAPHMYSLKIHLEPLQECVRGSHKLEPNKLFALVSYASGQEFKELSIDLPDITITQEAISMKEIQANMKERMMAVMDFIEDGIGLVKMMLMLCIITIIGMLLIAAFGGLYFAFKPEGERVSEIMTEVAGLPGSGDSDLGSRLSFTSEISDELGGKDAEIAKPASELMEGPYGTHYYPSLLHAYADANGDGKVTWEEAGTWHNDVGTSVATGDFRGLGTSEPPAIASSETKLYESAEAHEQPVVVTDSKGNTNVKKGDTWYEVLGGAAGGALRVVGGGIFWAVQKAADIGVKTVSPQTKTITTAGELDKMSPGERVKSAKREFEMGEDKNWYELQSDGSRQIVPEKTVRDEYEPELSYTYGAGTSGAVMAQATSDTPVQVTKPSLLSRALSGTTKVAGGVIGGIGKVAWGFARFFNEFHKGLKVGFGIAKTVCQVTSLLINIFTSITQVWTRYIAFQTCMEMYENQLGRGLCDTSPESCVNQLLGCLDGLDRIKQDTQNMIPEIGDASYVGGRGTVSASMMMYEMGKPGTVKSTCDGRMIYFKLYYGYYSELSMYFRTPSGSDIYECGERYYSEAELKAFLPRSDKDARPASDIFRCGDGPYHFSLYTEGKNIGTWTINYKASCDGLEGNANQAYTRAGVLLADAKRATSNVHASEGSDKESLSQINNGIAAADKYIKDGEEKDTITRLLTSVNQEIDKLMVSGKLTSIDKTHLQTARDKIEKAKEELK